MASSDDLFQAVDKDKLPVHVAIIMDGNGRWAKRRGLPRIMGHKAGMEVIRSVVKMSSRLGIKFLTLYAFSTENWKRPSEEVNFLMRLLVEYLNREVEELNANNVRITSIGRIKELPQVAYEQLVRAMNYTAGNTGLTLNLALNYGGRTEILDAINAVVSDIKAGKLPVDAGIDQDTFSGYLYTASMPDPDLLIRTSGERRVSNFLLYQIAYTEMYFSDLYWPDFDDAEYLKAIIDYQNRHRRYGAI
ncbi:isoprenyl transferase [Mahella sp.]|uniref:isoprenyl transferase n=1 Tax=Mahella sp. TaxID=2798721 RepID=UPI00343F1E1F|nr:undecaprenyl diphosphate synthase [Mahella sp.]